jgi:hypothetical protein
MCVRPVGRGTPGRSEWRRIAGWDPPLDGACALTREYPPLAGMAASNGSAMPGAPSRQDASNSEGDRARVR